MSIQVKIFASLRERLGHDGMELPAEGIATVADVWARVAPDGDEVAFFPPVTGGAP